MADHAHSGTAADGRAGMLPTGSMYLNPSAAGGSLAMRGVLGPAAGSSSPQGHSPTPSPAAPGSMGPPAAPLNRNASAAAYAASAQVGSLYSNGSASGSGSNLMLDGDGDTSLTSTRGSTPSSRAPSDRWSVHEETSLADLLYANVDAQNLLLPCRSRHLCTNSALTSRSISGDLAKLLWGEHMAGRWERVQKKVGHLHKQYLRKRDRMAEIGRDKQLGQLEEGSEAWKERKAALLEVPWFEKWHEMALSPASDPALVAAPASGGNRRKKEESAKPQQQQQQQLQQQQQQQQPMYSNTLAETLRRAAMSIDDSSMASSSASGSRDMLSFGRGISSSNSSVEQDSDSGSEDEASRRILRALGVKPPTTEASTTSHKRKRSSSNANGNAELASTLIESLEASKRTRAEARVRFEELRLTRERETRAWEKEKLELQHAREREREQAHKEEMQRLVDVVEKALRKNGAGQEEEQEEEEDED